MISNPRSNLIEFMKPDRHLYSLDAARGLAALAVAVYHWTHFTPSISLEHLPFYKYLTAVYQKGSMAVTFFFILSGFVFFWRYGKAITDRSCSFLEFAAGRFARLYPLHLLALFTVGVLQWIFYHRFGQYFVYTENDCYHFFLHLFFASNWGFEKNFSFNGPIWSVSFEIVLYAGFFLIAYLRLQSMVILCFFIASFSFLCYFNLGGRFAQPFICFLIGGVTYKSLIHYLGSALRRPYMDRLVVGVAAALWISMAVADAMAYFLLEFIRWGQLVLFPFSIAALVLAESALRMNFRPFKWVGELTYSAYCLHFPLQLTFVLVVLANGGSKFTFLSGWIFFSYFAVLILLSLLAFRSFERPAQVWLRNILIRSK